MTSFNNASSIKQLNESHIDDVDEDDILVQLESDLSVDATEMMDALTFKKSDVITRQPPDIEMKRPDMPNLFAKR